MAGQGSSDRSLTEWQEARSILARFDNNQHDLRKYGFSFITGLLAVNGLLGTIAGVTILDSVKAAVLIVTLGLIVALRLLDTYYRLFQEAAAQRARILENRLNLDITNDISLLLGLEDWWVYALFVYYGFVFLTLVLGVAILWPGNLGGESNNGLIGQVILAAIVASAIITWTYWQKTSPIEDWSVDKKIVEQEDTLRITYTNLDKRYRNEPATRFLTWTLDFQEPNGELTRIRREGPLKVSRKYIEPHDWLWEVREARPGLYLLTPESTLPTDAGNSQNQNKSKSLIRTNPSRKGESPTTIQVIPKQPKKDESLKVTLEKADND